MAFVKHDLFEIEIRDGEIIGQAPDFVIDDAKRNWQGANETQWITNPDNSAASCVAALYGAECINGESSEREIPKGIGPIMI